MQSRLSISRKESSIPKLGPTTLHLRSAEYGAYLPDSADVNMIIWSSQFWKLRYTCTRYYTPPCSYVKSRYGITSPTCSNGIEMRRIFALERCIKSASHISLYFEQCFASRLTFLRMSSDQESAQSYTHTQHSINPSTHANTLVLLSQTCEVGGAFEGTIHWQVPFATWRVVATTRREGLAHEVKIRQNSCLHQSIIYFV